MLELKPLFVAEYRSAKRGKEVIKLKMRKLNWENHKDQILKYINADGEFLVLSDLKEWYFFDDTAIKEKGKPFAQVSLHDLRNEFNLVENFYRIIERYKQRDLGEDLDKIFFNDLKLWIKQLQEIKFDVSDTKKLQLILGIINKFVFIQTLDDHSIINFRWIHKRWQQEEEDWKARGHFKVLQQFFNNTVKWFYDYYDTELFTTNEIDSLTKENNNIQKFYDTIKSILGITYFESGGGGPRGILQYRFRFIDEDIFGQAYETFLGEERHDEGIYYTPGYITQYIVENTISALFDRTVLNIENSIKDENFDNAKKYIQKLTTIKILDPACGSGSFLIKSAREIWYRYWKLVKIISDLLEQNEVYDTLTSDPVRDNKVAKLRELKNTLGFQNNRQILSSILLRHIHGNDLDPRAVAVAKVNVWLQAIKLSPQDFRYDKLPQNTNRVLPYLEMNIVNGDAVVGLPDQNVIDYLKTYHKDTISGMSRLRNRYLEDPSDPELVHKIIEQKKKLRILLTQEFSKYLRKNNISDNILDITIPHFWPLEFWYMYFEDSKPYAKGYDGVDCIVGNPPYESIQTLKKKKSNNYTSFLNFQFESSTGSYDLAVIFIEKGYALLKNGGEFGYIVTNKFMQANYGKGLRAFLFKNNAIKEIIDFGMHQIFKGAAAYTALLFLKHEEIKTLKYCRVGKLNRTITQLHEIRNSPSISNPSLTIFDIKNKELTELPWIFLSPMERIIFQKSSSLMTLNDFTQIFSGLGTGMDSVYIVEGTQKDSVLEIKSNTSSKKYLVEKELFRKVLKGKDINRWYVDWQSLWALIPYQILKNSYKIIPEDKMKKKYPKTWQYLLDHKNILDKRESGQWKNIENWHTHTRPQNLHMFLNPKIMIKVLANRSSCMLDMKDSFHFVGGGNAGGYGIILKDEHMEYLEYLMGLLNSSFFEWRIRKNTSWFDGEYFSFAKRFIKDLPIKQPNRTNQKSITVIQNSVKKILANMKNEKIFSKLWKKWSDQIKDSELSLTEILKSEEDNIKEGDIDYLWFDAVSFFISKKNKTLNEKFDRLEIRGDPSKVLIEIVGVNNEIIMGDGLPKSLFIFKLKDVKMLDHFYLSLMSAMESQPKVKTLKILFEKTKIPVLRPNSSKKTSNIMTKVYDEFSKISSTKTISLIQIENEIEELEARIDSIVLSLYDLTKNEISIVLDGLPLLPSYKSKIYNYFINSLKSTKL